MKAIVKLIIYRTVSILFLLISIFLSACRDIENIPVENKNTVEKLFSITVPSSSRAKASAMSEDNENENEIRSIEILLFDINGKYIYQPLYSNNINTNLTDSRIKTFSIKIPQGTYNIVILANARQSVTQALNNISQGEPKSSVIGKLLLSNDGKWSTNLGDVGYIPIPMWGEISSININDNTPINNPVNLIRMLSKVDVAVTGDAATKFVLESIRLYNYNNKGMIAPLSSNWDELQQKVTIPSIPITAQKPNNPLQNPLVYGDEAITTPGVSSSDMIYTFEALAGNSSSLQGNTCLVIGGTYAGDSESSYYRIDFAHTSSGIINYLALLRNHNYKVNITDISGSGLATPTDAFNSRPVNIKAEVVKWNDSQITDVVFDGQYMLGISQGEFSLLRDMYTILSEGNSLMVTTDNPTGWNITKIVDNEDNTISWLGLLSTSGNTVTSGTSGTNNIKLSLSENTNGAIRTGLIHLKAGRLTYIIKVIQSNSKTVTLNIRNVDDTQNIKDLIFAAPINGLPAAQQFKLKWTPITSSLTVNNYSIASTGVSFEASSGLPSSDLQSSISDPSGEKTFTVQPTIITDAELSTNPFLTKVSKIDFTVSNGVNDIIQSVFIRQFAYNLVFSNVSSSYWSNGKTYSFNVRSNANWRIKSVTENITTGTGSLLNLQTSDNLKVGAIGGINTDTGTKVSFRVVNNTVSMAGQISVVFESTDSPKKFNDLTLILSITNEYYPTMHKGWAGSNIYYDSNLGHLTFDDVGVTTHKTYQGVYFKGGSLYGISPVGDYSTSTILYPPSGTTTSNISWSAIPYVTTSVNSNPPTGKTNLDRAYLYEITNGTSGVGDICKYLTEKGWAPSGKKWRMPTSNEFNNISSYTIVGPFVTYISSQSDGSQIFNRGYNKLDTGSPFFPASGYSNVALVQIGTNGMYWSSSANGTNSFSLVFANNNYLTPNYEVARILGFSVRCVVDE